MDVTTLVAVAAVVAAGLHHHRRVLRNWMRYAMLRQLTAVAAGVAAYCSATGVTGPGGPAVGLLLAGATLVYLRITRTAQRPRRRRASSA